MRTGSPRNAQFKGNHRAEYAWFSIGDSLPLVSISSEQAARRIVEACRRGQSYLRFTLPARAGIPLQSAAPNFTSALLAMVNRLLPSPDAPNTLSYAGTQSFSRWSPSLLTSLTELAAAKNNEIRRGTDVAGTP